MQGSHNPLETSPSMHGRADLPLLVLVQLVPQLLLVVGQHLEPHALLWGDGGGARVSGNHMAVRLLGKMEPRFQWPIQIPAGEESWKIPSTKYR